ncbi:MAG: MBL fold metallo-hydrolase [Lachnospiraceae bacterium]|nr:MBL fold metallo-hydrolase [Lachnospiraceae bacterium]
METKVFDRRMPVLQNTLDFLEEMRRTRGSKVYDIDPFAEVFKMTDNVYSIFVESAGGAVDNWIHIVEGPDRALVIDTGWGIGNLRGLVEELLKGKPYDVVASHFHLDHTFGNYQFDEVYCHYYTAHYLVQQMRPDVWDRLLDENGHGKCMDFTRDDLIPFREYKIIAVPNHFIFDLGGGHEVEMIWMPGHASGGVVLLAKKERILFSGDAINTMVMLVGPRPGETNLPPYAEYNCVQYYRDELKKLAERENEWDYLYPGHDALLLGGRMVRDMYEAAAAVVEDPFCYDEVTTYQYITRENGMDGHTKTVGIAAVGYLTDRGIYPVKREK